MKKLFTSLTFLCAFTIVGYAQALFVQDFENGIEPMKLYDVDGRTPNANVAEYPDAWNADTPSFGNGTTVAVSNSWYTPAGSADDWMVTPGIMIEEGTILRWEAKAQDPSFRDGYQVLISTATDAVEDFSTVLFETGGEETSWQTRQEDLSAYAGQEIYIAWRNNSNDKFLLLVDNIFVGVPRPNDVRIVDADANINFGTALEGDRDLSITVQNLGNNEVTSMTASYSLNGGDTLTTAEVGISIPVGGSYDFAYADILTLAPGDNQSLLVFVELVNGEQDTDQVALIYPDFKVLPPVPDFDLVSSAGEPYNLYEVMQSGKAVVLDFFASWCTPCEVSTPALNEFYVANGAGEENLEVFGVNIEPSDDDNVVNNLGWGATYPKFSYSETTEEFWIHFNTNHGLGENAIPFFVMICPDLEDLAHSEIITSEVGFQAGMFETAFQPDFDECAAGLSVSVDEVRGLEDARLYPNPASEELTLDFGLESASDIQVMVMNQLGQVVRNLGEISFAGGQNRIAIETSDLPNGIYYVRMNRGIQISTFKFSVAH